MPLEKLQYHADNYRCINQKLARQFNVDFHCSGKRSPCQLARYQRTACASPGVSPAVKTAGWTVLSRFWKKNACRFWTSMTTVGHACLQCGRADVYGDTPGFRCRRPMSAAEAPEIFSASSGTRRPAALSNWELLSRQLLSSTRDRCGNSED